MLNDTSGLTGSTVAHILHMANPYTKAAGRGKRGGKGMLEGAKVHHGYPSGHPASYSPRESVPSASAVVADICAPFWEKAEIDEEIETHIVPRRSLTTKQNLRIFPPQIETETEVSTQLFKELPLSPGRLTKVTNQRVTWKSDTTLLRRGIPDANWSRGLHRQTSRTKRIDYTPEQPALDSGVTVVVEDSRIKLELNPDPIQPIVTYGRCPKCSRSKQTGQRCMCGNALDQPAKTR